MRENKIEYDYCMEANINKKLNIEIDGVKWSRFPVKTHFIEVNDTFGAIIEEYILPVAKPGDIIALGQKIVSIIQKRIILKKDIKVGFWANFLSKFATKTPAGFSVGNPLKMQVAINMSGLPRIMFAGICGGFLKLFGIRGVFYRLAGNKISELDGFYGKFFPQYSDMGILAPVGCDSLCNDLKKEFGFSFFVADVNDLGGNVLGLSSDLAGKEELLLKIMKDNPAGQSDEQTPIIIIRHA